MRARGRSRRTGESVCVLEDDDLTRESRPLEDVLDDASHGGDVDHALIPPLRAHLDDHDVVGADDFTDATEFREHGVAIRRRAATTARHVDRGAIAGVVMRNERRGRRERRALGDLRHA